MFYFEKLLERPLIKQQDPSLQASFLRQCLSFDKRPLGIFIGAGCPMAIRVKRAGVDGPLIPDIRGMTALVKEALSKTALAPSFELAQSHFKVDRLPDPNIEELLSHVRSLRRVAGADKVRGLSSDELDALDAAVCEVLSNTCECSLPAPQTPYHLVASWIGAISRLAPVEIFTTNYDLLMEQALESLAVPYFDGFVGSCETFFDIRSIEEDGLPPRWSRLWKIHGSINWHDDKTGAIRRSMSGGKGRVIYPSQLKYDETRRIPYSAMLDRLRAFLRKDAAVLVTSGFSFGDNHLNEVIVQGLQGSPTSTVFALLYGKIDSYPKLQCIAQGRSNLTLLASDGGIIGRSRCNWPNERVAKDCVDSTAVEWLDNAGKPGLKDARFTLGDFSTFASFLEELTGDRSRS